MTLLESGAKPKTGISEYLKTLVVELPCMWGCGFRARGEGALTTIIATRILSTHHLSCAENPLKKGKNTNTTGTNH